MSIESQQRGLAAHASNTPDRTAVIDGNQSISYLELYERTRRLACVLLAAGADKSRPVALMLRNGIEFIVATQASALAETPYVPINWHLKTDEIAYILDNSSSALLLCEVDLVEHARPAVSQVDGCCLESARSEEISTSEEPDELIGWPAPVWMFYTSGTTGRPKGVVHGDFDAQALMRQQEAVVALWGFRSDDVYLLAGPAYHAGPGGYAGTTIYVGGTVVIMRNWDARHAFKLIDFCRVSITFLTPAHFIRMLDISETERATYSTKSLRLVIHGGAPCPTEVKRSVLSMLPTTEVGEVYGGSEGGGTKILRSDWLTHPGSVGLPWPGVKILILDNDGQDVPAGVDGSVYIIPANGAGFYYHKDPDKTKSAWRSGAFSMGDIGHVDSDGFLYLTGRSNDLILWNGVNVYPREIEEVLHGHPAVVDCVVVGVPDRRTGEALVAIVELRCSVRDDDLRAHCRATLANFKCPGRFHRVNSLPREPNGKVRKVDIWDLLNRSAQS